MTSQAPFKFVNWIDKNTCYCNGPTEHLTDKDLEDIASRGWTINTPEGLYKIVEKPKESMPTEKDGVITYNYEIKVQAHKKYRVVLKTGEHSDFTDTRDLPNFRDLLVSGMYGITPTNGGDNIIITPDNVASIEEVNN